VPATVRAGVELADHQDLPRAGPLLGVLDIDSPSRGRFSEIDQDYVEALVDAFIDAQFAG